MSSATDDAVDVRLKEQRSANGLVPLTAERGTTSPDAHYT